MATAITPSVRAEVKAATNNTITVMARKGLRSTTALYLPKSDSITSEQPSKVSPACAPMAPIAASREWTRLREQTIPAAHLQDALFES